MEVCKLYNKNKIVSFIHSSAFFFSHSSVAKKVERQSIFSSSLTHICPHYNRLANKQPLTNFWTLFFIQIIPFSFFFIVTKCLVKIIFANFFSLLALWVCRLHKLFAKQFKSNFAKTRRIFHKHSIDRLNLCQ
jgi:hypothetical protein